MSPEEREALREIAEAAVSDGTTPWVMRALTPDWPQVDSDARFIAATDPPTVLALLDEVARLSAALEGSMALLRKLVGEINDEGYFGWAEGVQAEIDALARIDKETHDVDMDELLAPGPSDGTG